MEKLGSNKNHLWIEGDDLDKIIIKDDGDGLSLDIQVKSPFRCSEKSIDFGSKVLAVDYRQYNTFKKVS